MTDQNGSVVPTEAVLAFWFTAVKKEEPLIMSATYPASVRVESVRIINDDIVRCSQSPQGRHFDRRSIPPSDDVPKRIEKMLRAQTLVSRATV